MELCGKDFKAMMFFEYLTSLMQKQCSDKIKSTSGNEAPSKATTYGWFKEFFSVLKQS